MKILSVLGWLKISAAVHVGIPGTELCKKRDELVIELMTWHATAILQQEIASQDIL